MKSKSVKSLLTDPLKAGTELGLALSGLRPEIVFLFCSTHYEDPGELVYGLSAVLGDNFTLIGCSGDSYYANDGVAEIGASALGMTFDSGVKLRMVAKTGATEDGAGVVRSVLGELQQTEQPKLLVMFSDFRVNVPEVERLVMAEAKAPVVGGLAADDFRMEKCYLFDRSGLIEDSIVAVGFYGALDFQIYVGNTIDPIGEAGQVTSAKGNQVEKIDGMYAIDFIEKQTGEPALPTDRGVTSFMVLDRYAKQFRRLRSIQNPHAFGKPVTLYSGIAEGERVQVCVPDCERLTAEVRNIARMVAQDNKYANLSAPGSALVFSGSGRRYRMGGKINAEVSALRHCLGDAFQVAGLSTFGEFSPVPQDDGNYSASAFYNLTYVLTVFR
jgi:hypothetical protein